MSFFANLFGFVLNALYNLVGNYGLAIILFSILVKVLMIPISIKQQKTMKVSQRINEEMKQLQFKYKNDPEKLNQEVMALYKREKMSPFSGCFSAIIQIVLLLSVFLLVRSPLTYMKKIDGEVINKLQEIAIDQNNTTNYKEIAIINYINRLKNLNEDKDTNNTESTTDEKENDKQEEIKNTETTIEENNIEVENNDTEKKEINPNDYIDDVYINLNFLGLDLSKVPTEYLTDFTVYIIPLLYVISSFISIRLSTNMQNNKKKDKKLIEDGQDSKNEEDPMQAMNKNMSWLMPIMSISIAFVAPLGLALYWLVNNILMIVERVILDKFIKDEEEEAKSNVG